MLSHMLKHGNQMRGSTNSKIKGMISTLLIILGCIVILNKIVLWFMLCRC